MSFCACCASESFNRVTIDVDTSTNDSFVVISTHRAPMRALERDDDPRLPKYARDYLAAVAGLDRMWMGGRR